MSMPEFEPFQYKSIDALRSEIDTLGLELPYSDDLDVLAQPVKIGAKTAPNRFCVHPMEGCDSKTDGSPSDLVIRRYERFGAGGAGLIWFEACSIAPEARANPQQMMLTEDNVAEFGHMLQRCLEAAGESMGGSHRPICLLQLTHSGRYSRPGSKRVPILAHHSKVLDPIMGISPDHPLATDEYIDSLQDAYVKSAKLARDAGFDGVDVKACHRYLMSELLASFTREESRYGGLELENRTRLLREVHRRIVEEVPGLLVTSRMNSYDAAPYPYGWGVDKDDVMKPDLAEPLELAATLKRQGAPCLSITIGNPYYNPHFNRPYDTPIVGMDKSPEHPLIGVERMMRITREFQTANPDIPVIGAGYTYLRQYIPGFAAGAVKEGWTQIVGLGRGALAYPDFAKDIVRNGKMEPMKTCITCSGCTQIMRDAGKSGCIIRDREVYGPIYRQHRMRSDDAIRAESQRCRLCSAPTCQGECPASVDVPGFIQAVAEDDIRGAYDILRASNPLPELCSYICPVEVQCEGACIEHVFNGRPVPIKEIQRHVSRRARDLGWAKLRIPDESSGKNIAIVGAGPAGLSCAAVLLEQGHSVTLLEATDVAGGVARQTIPAERLESDAVESELLALLGDIPSSRLEWKFNTALGKDFDLDDLLEGARPVGPHRVEPHRVEPHRVGPPPSAVEKTRFDAVFIGIGLTETSPLDPTSSNTPGVEGALEFLKRMKRDPKSPVPQRVAVLGGGNTAIDAAATAKRRGAQDVYIVYRRSFAEMPAWPNERDEALNLGVHFLILTQPTGYQTGADGNLTALRTSRTVLGAPDESGRRRPEIVDQSRATLDVDLVIEALGQRAPENIRETVQGVEFNDRGRIAVNPATMAATRKNVYAGGDIVNGGDTAVRAVADGALAARNISRNLAKG